MEKDSKSTITELVGELIYLVRGQRVMFDSDLARLYGVETKAMNRAVRRNIFRFPEDFMFRLTNQEVEPLRCQIGTLKNSRGGHKKYKTYVFTEQGVAMLSSILHSERAIRVNVEIMRAFVRMRRYFISHEQVLKKLGELEKTTASHDEKIKNIFMLLRQMMLPPEKPKRLIGFGR